MASIKSKKKTYWAHYYVDDEFIYSTFKIIESIIECFVARQPCFFDVPPAGRAYVVISAWRVRIACVTCRRRTVSRSTTSTLSSPSPGDKQRKHTRWRQNRSIHLPGWYYERPVRLLGLTTHCTQRKSRSGRSVNEQANSSQWRTVGLFCHSLPLKIHNILHWMNPIRPTLLCPPCSLPSHAYTYIRMYFSHLIEVWRTYFPVLPGWSANFVIFVFLWPMRSNDGYCYRRIPSVLLL